MLAGATEASKAGGRGGPATFSALNFAESGLNFMDPVLFGLVVALLGNIIGGSDRDWGTLRYLYVRPVSLARLVTGKWWALAVCCALTVVVFLGVALLTGLVVFGWHPFYASDSGGLSAWHGMISAQWHVTVQNRLPGRPLYPLDGPLAGPVLDPLLRLVELQAGAGIADEGHDFTGYLANVLFDDWDEVWADAARACAAAVPLCARLRRWLEPVWGLRLPPADYAHNDLNLSNVLTDGARITGVVDWDEFGLGSRALDLIALAVDCERCGDHAAADRLLARAVAVAGGDRLRCLVSYRIIGGLAVFTHERHAYGEALGDDECAAESAILDRLQAAGHA